MVDQLAHPQATMANPLQSTSRVQSKSTAPRLAHGGVLWLGFAQAFDFIAEEEIKAERLISVPSHM